MAELLAERGMPLVLDYHNVTGPELYADWEPASVRRAARAAEELALLAPRALLGLADSPFNEPDLRPRRVPAHGRGAGAGRLRAGPAAPDPRVAGRLAGRRSAGGSDWLFVGRLVPSKGQHELVKALWAYRRLYDPLARLHLVGSPSSSATSKALQAFVDDLGLVGRGARDR